MSKVFYMSWNNVASGASADTYLTVASVIAAAGTSYMGRIRAINVGPADDAPADLNISIKMSRIADVSAGGAGTKTAISAANMPRAISYTADGILTGGHTYSVEPTAYETYPIFVTDMNLRGGFFKEWGIDDAPWIMNDQLIGVLIAPRTAAAATTSGTITYEEL